MLHRDNSFGNLFLRPATSYARSGPVDASAALQQHDRLAPVVASVGGDAAAVVTLFTLWGLHDAISSVLLIATDRELHALPIVVTLLAMSTIRMYHDGSRQLQDRFGSRQLADRLADRLARSVFTPDDVTFIQSRSMFFLATADADGFPDCSYKGGEPGFVRVVGDSTLAFPSYDGNGMFKSLGNLVVNPRVGMLFIDFEKPQRLRVNGTTSLDENDPLLNEFPGAQLIVRMQAHAIFPNCPRYIHNLQTGELSVYAPREGHEPPEPKWKSRPDFADVLPPKSK